MATQIDQNTHVVRLLKTAKIEIGNLKKALESAQELLREARILLGAMREENTELKSTISSLQSEIRKLKRRTSKREEGTTNGSSS